MLISQCKASPGELPQCQTSRYIVPEHQRTRQRHAMVGAARNAHNVTAEQRLDNDGHVLRGVERTVAALLFRGRIKLARKQTVDVRLPELTACVSAVGEDLAIACVSRQKHPTGTQNSTIVLCGERTFQNSVATTKWQ